MKQQIQETKMYQNNKLAKHQVKKIAKNNE
jgi:hypothetical protein